MSNNPTRPTNAIVIYNHKRKPFWFDAETRYLAPCDDPAYQLPPNILDSAGRIIMTPELKRAIDDVEAQS